MSRRRVVITGLGVVTSLGETADEMWENVCAGKSGVGLITRWDASKYPVKIGGENRRFASAGAGSDFDDRVTVFVFIRRQQSNLEVAFQISDALLELRDFFARHLRELGVARSDEFPVLGQLPPRGVQFRSER